MFIFKDTVFEARESALGEVGCECLRLGQRDKLEMVLIYWLFYFPRIPELLDQVFGLDAGSGSTQEFMASMRTVDLAQLIFSMNHAIPIGSLLWSDHFLIQKRLVVATMTDLDQRQ